MTDEHRALELKVWITVALFGAGGSTDVARSVRELWMETGRMSVDDVARRLYRDPGERRRQTDRAMAAAERSIELAAKHGHTAVGLSDTRYPPQLLESADPPPVLWISGDVSSLSAPCVGIVGSRDATPASLAVARTLGKELGDAGLVVVSGLARGVDAAAHAGTLAGEGRTIAVLGSGLDVVYPSSHASLARQVSQAGAVVSELPPWSAPVGRHFPLRNRIISGLSRAVVVVEASERSGSLITARLALEQGRDVLAVPGGVFSGRHRGSNALIKDGARLVETVDDVLEEIGWRRQSLGQSTGGRSHQSPMNVLESRMAPGEPYTVSELAERTGRQASETLVDLSILELAGRVIRQAGGQFVRMSQDTPTTAPSSE